MGISHRTTRPIFQSILKKKKEIKEKEQLQRDLETGAEKGHWLSALVVLTQLIVWTN